MLLLPWVRRGRERVLEEELRSYLEMAAEEARRSGMPAEEAEFAARRDFGSILRAKEDVRSEWISPGLESVVQDLRFAVRSLRRTPLFTGVAVLSLALGIGAASTVFSLVDGVLLKPLSYRDSGQLVYVREVVPELAGVYPTLPANWNHFSYWREHVRTFDGLCALSADQFTLTGAGTPEKIDGVRTSPDLFRVLNTEMARGTGLTSDVDGVVITDSLWQRRFRGAENIIGQRIVLDGRSATVAGVLRADFRFPKGAEFGSLAGLGKHIEIFRQVPNRNVDWDGEFDFIVIGRLKPAVTLKQGMAELSLLSTQMNAAHSIESKPHPVGEPLQDVIGGSVRGSLLVLQGAVLVLLMIVCVNLTNLMIARSNGRVREFSIRRALGADRRRLLRQLLTESFVLSFAGGALGVALSAFTIRFLAQASLDIPRLNEVHLNAAVLLFSLALTAACVCLFGMVPAYRAQAVSARFQKQSPRLREVLVGCEVALSTVLVFLAALFVSSLTHLLNVDKGFHEERAVAMDLSLPGLQYADSAARNRFFERTLSQMRALPGVLSAAMISGLPLAGESQVNGIDVPGSKSDWIDPATGSLMLVNVRFVSEQYFETLGISLVSGRTFRQEDQARKVTVISQRMAAKVWPGQNAIGRKFTTGSGVGEVQVVGVVRDTYNGRLDAQPTLIAYVPYQIRTPGSGSLVVRSAAEPSVVIRQMQKVIWAIDPNLPVSEVRTMAEMVDQALAQRRFQMRLASAFGAGALLLALIGIYGVVAYSVEQRRSELGLRLALGSTGGELMALILRRGVVPIVLGLLIGLCIAVGLGGVVRSLVFGVSTSDPVTMLAVIVILGGSGLLACVVPASRAARMDPAAVLRHE